MVRVILLCSLTKQQLVVHGRKKKKKRCKSKLAILLIRHRLSPLETMRNTKKTKSKERNATQVKVAFLVADPICPCATVFAMPKKESQVNLDTQNPSWFLTLVLDMSG